MNTPSPLLVARNRASRMAAEVPATRLAYTTTTGDAPKVQRPLYRHDAVVVDGDSCCKFLGTYATGGREFDLYACPAEPTVVARYGDEGNDYYSGLPRKGQYAPAQLVEAKRRAVKAGLLGVPTLCVECREAPYGNERHATCGDCTKPVCVPCAALWHDCDVVTR